MKFLKLFEEFTIEGDVFISVCGQKVKVKIPSTSSEMQRGYMFSDGPKEGEGMLFVFQKEEVLSFWMKDVKVPLDILFFDTGKNLVSYKKMTPGGENFYDSEKPAKYALELPSGWIDEYLEEDNCKLNFNI